MILDLPVRAFSRIEADRLDLTASTLVAAAEIRKQTSQKRAKLLTRRHMSRALPNNTGNIAGYGNKASATISARKLDAYITSGVTVSEEEVLNDFQRKNSKFDLA